MIIKGSLRNDVFVRKVAKRLTGKKLKSVRADKYGLVKFGGDWRALMRFNSDTEAFRGLTLLKPGASRSDMEVVERALVVMLGGTVDYRDHPAES